MGVFHLAWAFSLEGEPMQGDRLVLLALCDNAGDDTGIAWPSVATIARKAGLKERQTQRCLRNLETMGLISPYGRSKNGTIVYKIHGPKWGRHFDTPVVEDTTPLSSKTPKPSMNRQFEQVETEDFRKWLDHHEQTTGYSQPKPGTKVRAETRSMFDARVGEGYTPSDLCAATVGAFTDDYRRENGYYDTISVLRPTKIGSLIERGRRKPVPKKGERATNKISGKGKCARCGTDIDAHRMNNQSRMCDTCYERFENGST